MTVILKCDRFSSLHFLKLGRNIIVIKVQQFFFYHFCSFVNVTTFLSGPFHGIGEAIKKN